MTDRVFDNILYRADTTVGRQLGKAIDLHTNIKIKWQTEKQTNIDRQ